MQKLQKIQWQSSRAKMKQIILSNTFETGGLKNVGINLKFKSAAFFG